LNSNPTFLPRWILTILALWTALPSSSAAEPLLDDREVTVHSRRDVQRRRRELIRYLWGDSGFPNRRLPDTVLTNVASPARGLTNLSQVDELRVNLAPGLEGLAYHVLPLRPNGGLVVVHHGHACSFDDAAGPGDVGYGLQRTMNALLREGYGVLGVFMPRLRPGDCRGDHESLFRGTNAVGNPLRLFLETTAVGLNHAREQGRNRAAGAPRYGEFHMVGLSGGGWTTTVYAALDPSIRCSVPIAGSIPLYLRSGGSVGDREQFDPGFYRLAGYPDLYILGASGAGRRQIQILARRDDCCFGEAQHDARTAGAAYEPAMRAYEGRVQVGLRETGRGEFRLVIDETAPSHMISHHAIEDVLLPALRR